MTTATAEKFMTVDEFLALPDALNKKQMLIRVVFGSVNAILSEVASTDV